jgi:signal transduction histidine kinase
LIEGRQRVRDLRAATTPIDLPEALLEAGHEMAAGTIHFDLTVQGTPQPLRRTVSDESAKIGREAINNSVLHARCTKIEAELIYSKNFLVVRVRDDGAGFEPSAFVSKPVLDHWGIPGMQERAAALGGELNIFSKAGFGTEVELRVPGRVAFRKVIPVGPFHRLWRNIRRATARGTIVPRGSRDKSE